jgi:cell division protein DivIC
MTILNRLPSWLKNKYIVTSICFCTWLMFFDDRDMITQFRQSRELKGLEQSRDYYLGQINATREELEQLKSDPATLEKYAREKYRMKKDNEDLFIVSE